MLLKLFLLAPAVFAIPAPTHSIPYNAVAPRQTPAVVRPHAPNLIPLAHFAPLFGFRPRAANKTFHARDVAEHLVRGVPINAADNALTERGSRSTLTRRAVLNSTETAQAQSAVAATCVDSSGNDTYISSVRQLPSVCIVSGCPDSSTLQAFLLRRSRLLSLQVLSLRCREARRPPSLTAFCEQTCVRTQSSRSPMPYFCTTRTR